MAFMAVQVDNVEKGQLHTPSKTTTEKAKVHIDDALEAENAAGEDVEDIVDHGADRDVVYDLQDRGQFNQANTNGKDKSREETK